MKTAVISHVIQALEELRSGKSADDAADFDLLVRVVEEKVQDHDREALRRFGVRIDSIVASILAPLIETGEVVWEPRSRTVAVSDFGLLLLRSAKPMAVQTAFEADESHVALR